MLLNDDLSVSALVHAGEMDWVPSPTPGVDRRMLFRIGTEKARATSVVRYAPGSQFPRHGHPGGEEILVLDGIFQDETGAFPAGSYIRNPPGTGHAPGSTTGCTILVKLWQFSSLDRDRIVRLPGEGEKQPLRSSVSASRILFKNAAEEVVIEEWEAGARIDLANRKGLELLVLDGSFTLGGEEMKVWSWLRVPAGPSLRAQVGARGARVWFKRGALLLPDVCAFAGEQGQAES